MVIGDVNTNLSVVDIGYPGILPCVNKEAVKKSIMVALALNSTVPETLTFDRKNYYYPDLPKGYQITQFHNPIGTNGFVMINVDGVHKKIDIHDTHLEEDTANMDHLSTYSLLIIIGLEYHFLRLLQSHVLVLQRKLLLT